MLILHIFFLIIWGGLLALTFFPRAIGDEIALRVTIFFLLLVILVLYGVAVGGK